MKVADLLDRRRDQWRELEKLCERFNGKRLSKESPAELMRFATLYRSACADLALADAYQLPANTIQYLHQLVARAHNQLYRSRRFDVQRWLQGDPAQPAPQRERLWARNREWRHMNNADIISMPDKWEYPWFAAWDLAFHCVPLALVDPELAKNQLEDGFMASPAVTGKALILRTRSALYRVEE